MCSLNKIKDIVWILVLFLFIYIYIITFDDVIIVEIEYEESNINGTVEMFWTDERDSWSASNSSRGTIENSYAKLELNNEAYNKKIYRMDFLDTKQIYTIKNFKIGVNEQRYNSLSLESLLHYIEEVANIEMISLNGDSLTIRPQNNDSYVVFNNEFSELLYTYFENERHFGTKNIIVLVLLCLLIILYYYFNRIYYNLIKVKNQILNDFCDDNKRVFIYFLICFGILTMAIFWKFISGENLYIFYNEIANDSANQTFPNLIYLSRMIENGNFSKTWNGLSSLGNIQETIVPTLNNWVALFGKDKVAYLLGVSQFLKVFFAGIFFYGYLRTMKLSRSTSGIFSIGYAYCSQIIARGAWQTYPNEVLLFALWLFCFEKFYVEKKYGFLPIVSGLFFLNFSGYYTVFYTGIFFAYAFFRFYSENRFRDICWTRIKEHCLFILSIGIGLLISAFSTFPSLLNLIDSNRFSSGVEKYSLFFGLSKLFTEWLAIKMAFFRTIGNDILDLSYKVSLDNYNFLEGPAFYCGILGLIIIPLGICLVEKRKRIWYFICGLAGICYIFVRPIRYAANGFSGMTFKLSSLWLIVLILLIAAQIFEILKRKKIQKDRILFVLSGYLLLTILFYIEGLNNVYLIISILFMIIYGFLLAMANRKIRISSFVIFILLCCILESFWMTYRIVNNRRVFTKELMAETKYFNDGTTEVIDNLNENDYGFYRLDKSYMSVFLCDSLFQGYHGTKGYLGGNGERKLTSEFYIDMGFPMLASGHYLYGFESSTSINTLLNLKYYLTQNIECTNYGYEKIKEEGNISLYENLNSLSLGSYYEQYIPRSDFDNMTIAQKRNVMMKACVLEENEIFEKGMKKITIEECTNSLDLIRKTEEYLVNFTEQEKNERYSISFRPVKEEEVSIVKLKINNKDSLNYVGTGYYVPTQIYFTDGTTNYSYYNSFMKGTDEYIYEFNVPGTNQVTFEITDDMEVEDIEVYIMPQSVYYKGYLDSVKELSSQTLELSEWTESYYKGCYSGEKDGFVFFAIPYDEDWDLTVDGKDVPIVQANIGFMGAFIEAGEHDIVLEYHSDHSIYYICSAIGCILCVAYVIICIRKRGKENVPGINSSTSV